MPAGSVIDGCRDLNRRVAGVGPNVWPETELPGFRADVEEYYRATAEVARRLYSGFGVLLAGDPGFFFSGAFYNPTHCSTPPLAWGCRSQGACLILARFFARSNPVGNGARPINDAAATVSRVGPRGDYGAEPRHLDAHRL